MIPATAIWFGRYWYDMVTFVVAIIFFLSIVLLLFRNTMLGWAMTWAFSAWAFVFLWSATSPPVPLPPEAVTLESVSLRIILIVSSIPATVILLVMRMRRETVVVGRAGSNEPCKSGESCSESSPPASRVSS